MWNSSVDSRITNEMLVIMVAVMGRVGISRGCYICKKKMIEKDDFIYGFCVDLLLRVPQQTDSDLQCTGEGHFTMLCKDHLGFDWLSTQLHSFR